MPRHIGAWRPPKEKIEAALEGAPDRRVGLTPAELRFVTELPTSGLHAALRELVADGVIRPGYDDELGRPTYKLCKDDK